ncbi:MAG: hypothetical protein HN576_16930 [Bacteriovoracaceae bacterium]|jgi:hypothetical protein|nr:hypothetical protein [Bacteriovoracaceae bacterium]
MMPKNVIKLGMISIFLYSSVSLAGGWQVTGRPKASGNSGGVINSTPSEVNGVSINATEATECSTDSYMPMSMLQNLIVDQEGFQFRYDDELRKLKVEIPQYYGNCLDLEFEFELKDNKLFVKAKNANNNSSHGTTDETVYQKYLKCLQKGDSPVVTRDNGGVNFHADRAKLKDAQYMELNITGDEFNTSKDLQVMFLSPTATLDNGSFGPAFGNAKAYNHCFKQENINKSGEYTAYFSPDSRIKRTVYEACKSNEYKKIISALKNLDPKSVGNYKLLKKVLEQALAKVLDDDAKKIYEEMELIGRDFKMTGGKPSLDAEEASDLADDYVVLLEKLNKNILTPYIIQLEELIATRAGPPRPSREQRKEIDKQIKLYNQKIQEYSKNTKKLGYKNVMEVLKHYGHTDQAKMVEGFRLKSHAFGRVYKDGKTDDSRGDRLTIKTANKTITETLEKFDGILHEWDQEASSRDGDMNPALSQKKRHAALTRTRDKRYQEDMKKIQEKYKDCVGWFRTQFKVQKCQQKAQRSQKTALRRRAAYNRQIGVASEKFGRYSENYDEYKRTVASTSAGNTGLYDPVGYYSEYSFGEEFVSSSDYYSLGGGSSIDSGTGYVNLPQMQQPQGGFQNFGGGGGFQNFGGGFNPFGNSMMRGY